MAVTFTFFSELGGGWLDVPHGNKDEWVQVQSYPQFHGGPNQQWRLIEVDEYDGEFYQIQSLNSELVLDVEGGVLRENTKIIQYHATGNDNQLWRFEQVAQPDRTGFIYVIHPRNSQLAMNVADNGLIQLHGLDDLDAIESAWWLVQAGGFF